MKGKHTQGPWIYARDFNENGKRAKVTTIAVCCDFVIGLPSAYEGGNYRDGDPSGDPEADACLIAAAPELLAAAKFIVQSSSPISTQQEQCWLVLRAAIAKAEGGGV